MSASLEASELLRSLASPAIPGESVKAVIGRAARRAGLTYGRARRIWYRLAVVTAEEIDRLRREAAQRRGAEEDAARDEYQAALRRIEDLLARFESLERLTYAVLSDKGGEGADSGGAEDDR